MDTVAVKNYFRRSLSLSSVLLTLLLLGCSTTSYVPQVVETVRIQPQTPSPIQTISIEWHVLTPDTTSDKFILNGSYMSLSWQDYLTLGQYMKDINRFINQQNFVVGYCEDNTK
jgi:hypothetical protein